MNGQKPLEPLRPGEKYCKTCKERIAKSASTCPKCGGRQGLPIWAKLLIVFGVIFTCLVGCVSGCVAVFNGASEAVNEAVEETKNEKKDEKGQTSFKVGESFKNKKEKITMLEVNKDFKDYSKYLGPKSGNKVVMVKFEVENVGSDDELYVLSSEFNAFADDEAAENFYYAADKYKDLTATLGKGKKVTGYVFYEVPKTSKKIVVEYNPDFWEDGNAIEFIVQE